MQCCVVRSQSLTNVSREADIRYPGAAVVEVEVAEGGTMNRRQVIGPRCPRSLVSTTSNNSAHT